MWINLPKPYHSPHVSLLVAFKLMYKGVIGLKCIVVSRLFFPILAIEHYKFSISLHLDNCGYGKPRGQISCG
jgi:hypothetical protein